MWSWGLWKRSSNSPLTWSCKSGEAANSHKALEKARFTEKAEHTPNETKMSYRRRLAWLVRKHEPCQPEPVSSIALLGVAGFFGKADIRSKLRSQLIEQVWVHKLVFIWNMQRDNTLSAQSLRKLAADAIQMRLLHAEDNVCPADVSLGDNNARLWLSADRADLISRKPLEQLLSGKAAKLVLAAHKKQLL